MQSTGNKTIVKNTIMLYIRLIVNMIITLFTARVVLQTLGVEDYGIYGVIGGVLSMFSFLNSSMSGATSRFLTYELGKGRTKRLAVTFSTSIIVHIVIALLIAFLCETIGIWFINNKLVIPETRLIAAHWVFQFAIFSMIVSVTQVPYNATIFSHERMDVYAYVEIVSSILKLLIVYLLVIGDFDKLILYAVLNFSVSFIIALYYRYYCVRYFEECRFHWILDKPLLKEMLSFSGWDLYGNLSVMARTQGVNMILNMFFGPIMNAAADIASRIQSLIMNLSTNVSIATRPQIVLNYSQGNHEKMISLMRDGARLTFILMLLFSVPIIFEIHYILKLWLGVIPKHTEMICILTLLWNLVVAMNITTNHVVQATTKIRLVSIVSGTCFLSVIPVTYFCFNAGVDYWFPFAYNVMMAAICPVIGGYTLQKYIKGYSINKIMVPDLLRDWVALIIICLICYLFIQNMNESFIRVLYTCTISTILTLFAGYYIVFPAERRQVITNFIIDKIWKRKL